MGKGQHDIGIGAGHRSLITSIVIGARTSAVLGVKAKTTFALAIYGIRDLIKKLGSLVPPLAAFVYCVLSGGGKVLSWQTKNFGW